MSGAMRLWLIFAIACPGVLASSVLRAQEEPFETAAAPPPAAETAPAEMTVSRQEFEALRQELQVQKEEVDALKARQDARDEAEYREEQFAPSLDIYGFMAIYGGKWFVEENTPLAGIMNTRFSFAATDVNIYFSGQLTETLSALVELRFSFMPNGADQFPQMARVDTAVVDPITSEEVTLGGVEIERAMFTWQPFDGLGISAGRYLTPFGIWNEDHGAPVVIPVNQPYLILRHTIPLAQTGLMLHGRFFPGDNLTGRYAITLSNGRGPVESTLDLDNNKALGLRLHLSWRPSAAVELAVGGYGFIGQYTDSTKQLDIASLGIVPLVTEQYREYSASADLLLRVHGFRFQAEWASGRIVYDAAPPARTPILNTDISGQYMANHNRWDTYVLLAYEWGFKTRSNKEMKLTPFVMGEWDVMYDNLDVYDTWLLRYGFNFKPHYMFTAKLDFANVTFPNSDILTEMWAINMQAAVSF
jgi:hypothetical protein